MEAENSRKRRRYSAEFKAQVLKECDQPGTSVAKVARANGINDNIVHGWRKLAREANAVVVPPQFVPLTVASPAPLDDRSIDLELRRGALTVRLSWPLSSAMDLSSWMRELLR